MKSLNNIIIVICILSSIIVTGCSDVKSTKESNKENTKKEQQVVKLTEKEDDAVHMLMQNTTAFAFGSLSRKYYVDYIENVKKDLKDESREKYIEINDKIKYGDFEEAIRASVNMINKFAGSKRISMDDLKIKTELKEENNIKEDKCPICGGDCPKDSECLKYSPGTCTACGKTGTLNKDLVEWTNNHGEHLTTHKGKCTEAMKLEDEAHTVKAFHCEQCGRAVQTTSAEWTGICDYCQLNNESTSNTNGEVNHTCPKCGGYLSISGKCADCGYGYE